MINATDRTRLVGATTRRSRGRPEHKPLTIMLKMSLVSGMAIIAHSLDAAWFHGQLANAASTVGSCIVHFVLRF